MQQTTGVAVLATHLAHTDRRALSQAWYSALHLAEPMTPSLRARLAPGPATAARGTPQNARAAGGEALARNVRTAHGYRAAPRASQSQRRETSAAPERRIPTELARRIERGLSRRAPRGGASSFTVAAAGGRVHLIVRSDGASTRVVAVCAPPLRERVERALAHVRFALAGSGLRAEVA